MEPKLPYCFGGSVAHGYCNVESVRRCALLPKSLVYCCARFTRAFFPFPSSLSHALFFGVCFCVYFVIFSGEFILGLFSSFSRKFVRAPVKLLPESSDPFEKLFTSWIGYKTQLIGLFLIIVLDF